MLHQFKQVTIIGLGLIGGSLGMALRRRGLRVTGYSRKPTTLRVAKRRGAIDVGTTDLRAAVRGAGIVVLATPVDTIVPFARRVARLVRPGTILTDVGSTKSRIVRTLERALPRHVSFVGGHPLAGSEQRGIGAASKDLLHGSVCILTKTPRTDVHALRAVARLWKPLVGRVMVMSPARHDRLLATMSHLPHLLAYTLVGILPREGRFAVPPSFAQMTRIAKSDPGLWNAIFFSNRAELLRSMDEFNRHWRLLRRLVAGVRQSALRRALSRAKNTRDALQDA